MDGRQHDRNSNHGRERKMKKDRPASTESALHKHTDILLQIFGRVNLDEYDAQYLFDWIVDHKRELGRKYKEIQEWGDDVYLEVLMQRPVVPQKRYYCRYCGNNVIREDVAATGDDVIVCRRCAGYE